MRRAGGGGGVWWRPGYRWWPGDEDPDSPTQVEGAYGISCVGNLARTLDGGSQCDVVPGGSAVKDELAPHRLRLSSPPPTPSGARSGAICARHRRPIMRARASIASVAIVCYHPWLTVLRASVTTAFARKLFSSCIRRELAPPLFLESKLSGQCAVCFTCFFVKPVYLSSTA